MKKPNFIIAGFPKCGTTSLFHYLKQHPEIFMPNQKELHFFTQPQIYKLNKGPKDKVVKQSHIKSEKEYLELFKSVKDEIAVGDASPSYINYPENFGMIKQYLNDPKVIVIVRDPIDRAYSNYLHLKRELRETMDFFRALKNEDSRREESYSDFWYYRFNSTYYKKILMAKKTFSNVLVLTAEEFKRNPEITLKKVYSFLGVKLIVKKQALETKFNVGGYYKKNLITSLIFQPSRFKNALKKIIKPTRGIKMLVSRFSRLFQIKQPSIDQDSLNYLKKHFSKEINNLKKMNIDVSKWRKY
jgi:hypothetical protein